MMLRRLYLALYLLPILVVCSAAPQVLFSNTLITEPVSGLMVPPSLDFVPPFLPQMADDPLNESSPFVTQPERLTTTTTPPLKVLLISVHPPHGGGSAHSSRELAVGLRNLGHTVVHVAPYAKEDPNIPNEQHPDLLWMQANFPWDTLYILPEAQKVMDLFISKVYQERGPFDVVILGRESMLWHLPAIREVHGSKSIISIVRGAYINRLVSNETIDPELKEKLLNLYRSADRIICIARHLKRSVITGAGLQVANKTLFLPNPIDIPDILIETPREPNTNANSNYLVNTKRLAEDEPVRLLMPAQIKARKRPFDAIHTLNGLVQRGINALLTICGSGPDMHMLQDLIRQYNLEDRVVLKGHVTRTQVLQLMRDSEIVLLFSDNEGRPRVLQEAIAAGKGVVGYDNPGSFEVLNEWGHTFDDAWPIGRLVPIGSVTGAIDAIADLSTYFRSDRHTPLSVVPPPSSLEVLHDWVRIIRESML